MFIPFLINRTMTIYFLISMLLLFGLPQGAAESKSFSRYQIVCISLEMRKRYQQQELSDVDTYRHALLVHNVTWDGVIWQNRFIDCFHVKQEITDHFVIDLKRPFPFPTSWRQLTLSCLRYGITPNLAKNKVNDISVSHNLNSHINFLLKWFL